MPHCRPTAARTRAVVAATVVAGSTRGGLAVTVTAAVVVGAVFGDVLFVDEAFVHAVLTAPMWSRGQTTINDVGRKFGLSKRTISSAGKQFKSAR